MRPPAAPPSGGADRPRPAHCPRYWRPHGRAAPVHRADRRPWRGL